MKLLSKLGSSQRHFRRSILTATILPAVFASSAFATTNWSGPVALDTGAAPDDIHVLANSTVTLANTGSGLSITETVIFFEPTIASELLTVNGPGLTLRSINTVLSIANSKTITINGTGDFAPGALSTGPTVGTATDTAIALQKNGGAGTLILDDHTGNFLANATLRVLDGRVSIVGDGASVNPNPISSLSTRIEIGSTGFQTPILRFGSSGATNTTFINSFNVKNTGTIEHVSTTTDSISNAAGDHGITGGKTLTVNVVAGGLIINGTIGNLVAPNSAGGLLKKTGAGTTLTLTGSAFVSNLNIAEGRVDVPGQFRTSTTPTFGANTTLSLTNTSASQVNGLPATVIVPTGATLEGVPGAFTVSAGVHSTLSLTGGTLNLGIDIGPPTPGLATNLYTTGWQLAQNAFGGPQFPANTYATYVSYFNGIGTGTSTTTSAGGVTELSFDPAYGDTAMFQILAPTYTRKDDIVARFKGKIIITTPGAYTFATDADDGSMLYIDGATVVSNNASQGHIRRTGTVALGPGLHDIDIGYYEGGGLNGIVVDYNGPDTGGAQTVIPNAVLLPLGSAPATFQNPIAVSQNSVINTGNGATAASLALSVGKVVNVNGYQLDMGPLTLTGGAGLYTINANTQFAEVCARSVSDGGAAVTLVNNGPGTLVLESGASPQLQNAASSVTSAALGIVLGGAGGSPTGAATINVNGGSLTLSSKGGDQSYTPVGMSFTNGGIISAGKICEGVAGTVGTPIRTTLTPAITVNNAAILALNTRDNYILRVGAISGAGSVSVLSGTVEHSGLVNLTGTGQFTVANAKDSTLAGASAAAVSVTDGTLTNTGTLNSASSLTVTKSTLSSSGNITATGSVAATDSTLSGTGGLSAGSTLDLLRTTLNKGGNTSSTGAMTITDSTVTNGGTLRSSSTMDIVHSTVTSTGNISATGALTATNSTITANAGATAASISVTDSKFINTGALATGAGGFSLSGAANQSTLELHGGTISGPIAATGGVIHATSGLTVAATTATFTGFNPTGLLGRFTFTGGGGQIHRGDTQSGILSIQTGTNGLVEKVLNQPLNFPNNGTGDATISTFFNGANTGPGFTIGFFGNFTAPTTGLYTLQTGLNDDDAGFWVDLDGDGVFEGGNAGGTPGANGNELIAWASCCGDGANQHPGTVTLTAGNSYKVGIAVEDGQGESGLVGRITAPNESLKIINPASLDQAGWWSYGLPNQVIVDSGAELDIRAINGDVNVLVNGHLEFDGAGSSTVSTITIGNGGIVEVGSGPPSPAGLAEAALPVPEPASLGLIILGALGCLTGRRRSSRD